MSDRPSTPNDKQSAGWHQPDTSGGWYPPKQSASEKTGGWRVPVLPTSLAVEPKNEGIWHLPKPEDTTFTPEDVTEVVGVKERPPDAIDPIDALTDALRAAGVEDDSATRAVATFASPEDFMETAVVEAEPLQLDLLDDEDEEDSGAFGSMSELLALASLVEDAPTDTSLLDADQLAADISDGETEVLPAGTDLDAASDPGEYARRALAQLGESPVASPTTTTGDPSDPGEYARRQLEQLGGPASEFTPVPQSTAPIDPVMIELAQRFRDTESQVRSLRQSFQQGQITRDDLQTRLKGLMILDNEQMWWMMGAETDTWYKFENNQWVAAVPAALSATAQPQQRAGMGDMPGVSLEYLSNQMEYSQREPTLYDPNQYETGGLMDIPRTVDQLDQNYTMVGPAAYASEINVQGEPTVFGRSYTDPTMMAQPVQYGAFDRVEAPYDEDAEPPDYALDAASAPNYEEIARQQRAATTRTLLLVSVIGLGLLLMAGTGFVVAALSWYNGIVSKWETQIAALQNYEPSFQTVKLLDARGGLIAELNSQEGGARIQVQLREIAPEMIHAVVSLENERFYNDPGWDIVAISRAFLQNVTSGQIESGASTITQQIARTLVLQSTELTAQRKIEEIVVAGEIAKRFDKNFILTLYLNEIFFGNQSYGVEAAAEFYFNKKAANLNIAESAMLAGLIASPAAYDPIINRNAAFDRMKGVIRRMTEVGCLQFQHEPYLAAPFCINRSDVIKADGDFTGAMAVQIAFVEGANFKPRQYTVKYPHFVNLVQSQLEAVYGSTEMFRQGFTVRTTLIPEIQDAAQDALIRQLAVLVNQAVNVGSVMATDPNTGAIWAMVGSPDFSNDQIKGQINYALTYQQPGSAIKPVLYTAALEGVDKNNDQRLDPTEYFTPATVLWDVPTVFPEGNYAPVNFDRRFRGPVAMRYALANSYNIPAVKTMAFIGIDKFKSTAQRMGIDFAADAIFSLPSALGATEVRLYDMMEVYATIASGGKFVRLFAIESITDAQGRVVPLPERPQPQQVVQPQIAYLMQSILSDDNARADQFGTGSLLTLPGLPTQDYVGAKTGTTNNAADLWTMGFTRSAVVGVWLGRHDNGPTFTNGSFTAVAPVWNAVMRAAMAGKPAQPFTNPGNVVSQQVCADTGTLPGGSCVNQRVELFLISQPPPNPDQAFVQTVEVDTWTGLRANQNCPDNRITKTFASLTDQSAVSWLNSTAEGQAYARRLGLPLPFEVAPTSECALGSIIPTARIVDPFDNKTVSGLVNITGQVSANPQEFNRYQLEFASAQSPDAFQPIGQFSTQQQPNAGAPLGTWDTTAIPNGTYILRLTMISNAGGYLHRTVTVNVNNVLPTPTPQPTPTPFIPAEPLPFDTVPAQTLPLTTPTIAVPEV